MTHVLAQTRRRMIAATAATAAALCVPELTRAQTSAPATLSVAYAGSMTSLFEGPLKTAAANAGFILQGKPAGSGGLAQQIVGGTLRPDVFMPVTAPPMRIVLDAKKATTAVSVGHTEMVIAYAPSGPLASLFAAAAKGSSPAWWQILTRDGVRFGRTAPNVDPQGQNIIFTMQLAAAFYHQPDLAQKVLGPTDNPAQIFEEATVQARLQSGQLDAASAYKVQPAALGMPYITLPPQINLGDATFATQYAQATLVLGGKTLHPQPLVYYAAALTDSPNAAAANAFVAWLRGKTAQDAFRSQSYDPPGNAPALAPSA